jgi:signal transduction histidine kinase
MINSSESGSRTATSSALEDHLAEWSLQTGITVEIWALPEQPLPALITEIVHGAIRDVLQEVERQAQARTVSIALTVARGGLRLTVSDDGLSTSAEAYEATLSSRRVELAGIGGRLTVNGVQGEGTTVSAAVPRRALG